jgi:hypothetical protein
MSDPANGTPSADHVEFEQVGTGLNVYETPELIEGRVQWLETPEDVINFVDGSTDVSDVIVIARGGTTTFLTMALNAGVRGVVTLQGAPESHLGILCREYGIPCIMTVQFDRGVHTSRGEVIPANGVRIRLDCSERPQGTVSVEAGAPVEDRPADVAGPPAMSEEQMAQIQLLLTKFGGVVPKGVEGDAIMQAEMKTRVLFGDADSLHRDLTVEEVNEAIRYYTWNEWDALASRATEGESGLIPRQEYEALGIMHCWFRHPDWLRAIEDRIGIDGMIEIGRRGRTEIGTKVNMLHLWALATAPSFGRGIALELNLHDKDFAADRIRDCFGVVRRLYTGLWGEGEAFLTSMKNFHATVLEPSWIERFTGDRIDLSDDDTRSAFQRFQGAAELMAFLLHFDNRLGVSDHGPYPTDDGGFVLVRDIFLNEPAWPWNDAESGLPWSVTVAMFFDPGTDLKVEVLDISTIFTTPANYLPYVRGVAVYQRDKWDSPIDDVRPIALDDMATIRQACESAASDLYARIADMSQREKIEAGALTYTAGFALPIARAAGMLDELIADHEFLDLHPAVAACYDTIISGVATELIPRLFLTGSWGNPVPTTISEELSADDREYRVLHALRVRGLATLEAVADTTGLPVSGVSEVLAGTTERGHTSERTGRVPGFMLTPAGRARHVLLNRHTVTKVDVAAIDQAYSAFLEPNREFKQFTTEWQQGQNEHEGAVARLDDLNGRVGELIGTAAAVVQRFGRYGDRFSAALQRFRDGDASALAQPMSESYHDIWMELHEDLLVTAGRERSDQDE